MTLVITSVILLVVGAVASALLGWRPRVSRLVATSSLVTASVLCLAACLPRLAWPVGGGSTTFMWPMPLGRAVISVDGLSAWFLASIAILSAAVVLYSWAYTWAEFEPSSVSTYYALLCLLVAALVIVVTAADAILFLAGWEGMTLAAFFLVGSHHRRAEVRRAAWMYLVATHLGTALFVLPMFGMLAAKSGQCGFAAFQVASNYTDSGFCVVLFVLALLGFGTKAGFMPMHIWLPVAHPAAPTPVSALLSGMVIKTGIYGILRVLSWMPPLPSGCAMVMLGVGMVSGVLGVLYALAQHDIKRLLAYHSVENIGIIGLGIGMGMLGQADRQPVLIALGYGGALLHVLNHALFKGLLFLSAGAVIHSTGTGDIDRLGGLARKTPVNAVMFLIAAISICGLPPFNGFVSEWIIYGSLFGGAFRTAGMSAGVPVLGIVCLALMGGLALARFSKVFGVVFLGEPRDSAIQAHPTPGSMRVGMSILAALCVGIGLLPGLVLPLVRNAVGAVARLSPQECDAAMAGVLAPAGRISGMAILLLAILGLPLVARCIFSRRRVKPEVALVATWGCGYAAPTARMQYTASSFAWPLIQSFHSVLWSYRKIIAPVGAFPRRASLESHTADMAEHDLFAPLFCGIGELFRRVRMVSWSGEAAAASPQGDPAANVRPLSVLLQTAAGALRRRSIHASLAFIVIMLLIVFCVEWFLSPVDRSVSDHPKPACVADPATPNGFAVARAPSARSAGPASAWRRPVAAAVDGVGK